MKYIVWLQSALKAGNPRAAAALLKFGSARAVYESGQQALAESGLFTGGEIKRLLNKDLKTAEKIINDCESSGISVIPYGEGRYPEALKNIADPPLVIYVKGRMPDFDNLPCICIVGPRNVSEYGKKAAFSLSLRLAKAGFVIISGGALGGDTCVHLGALKGGGFTVLVTPCGINYRYLVENAPLRNEIAEKGCLLSEYPPGEACTSYNFEARNRLMSALAQGVVIIEAPKKSGTLITARHALEQGRDLFVIPGTPGNPQYTGSNELLRDGAKPLIDASDIFNEYIPCFSDKIDLEKAFNSKDEKPSKKINKKILDESLSKEAKIVYNHLDKQEFYPDDLVGTGLSESEILSALVELEVEAFIVSVPGGRYRLV